MSPANDTLRPDLEDRVLALRPGDEHGFLALAGAIREFQNEHNPVVRSFGNAGRYLPIEAFRLARVATFPSTATEVVFRSSGTSKAARAEHPVASLAFYGRIVETGFARVFGSDPGTVVGYLPRYAADSSLVAMMLHLVRRFGGTDSAVFADDRDRLASVIDSAAERGDSVLVVGAAFGLLDLAQNDGFRMRGDVRVIETGGMKTHRRSVSREALHEELSHGLGISIDRIGGEYGMCELTSQAWSRSGWWYRTPPWMRFEVVDPDDPDAGLPDGRRGLLAVTDLANLYTASSLLTEDLAVAQSGRFSVLGRASGAALRGCNFLMERDS